MKVQPGAEIDVVQGDRTLLKSCLLNMGINASHAMPSGGTLAFATREVTLTSEDCKASLFDIVPGRYIELRVEDTGTGIPPEVIERIFEPFFTTKEQGRGTGLGLAAVLGTVQQHDGSVTVQSESGRGASFAVRLPLAEQPASPPQKLNTAVHGHGVVLVVDDHDLVLKMAKITLEHLGYEVLTASDGMEAVEVYDRVKERVQVVLLDMTMPKMNGLDCFVELKRLNPNVRVIATSGYSSPNDLQKMQRLGMTIHLSKPYQRAELSMAILKARKATGVVGDANTPC